jgi:hypothetical protein
MGAMYAQHAAADVICAHFNYPARHPSFSEKRIWESRKQSLSTKGKDPGEAFFGIGFFRYDVHSFFLFSQASCDPVSAFSLVHRFLLLLPVPGSSVHRLA